MAPSVVVITGCSSGIGLVTAVHLAKECKQDFKVYATVMDLSDTADLETAAGDALNKTLFIRELDVTKKATISAAVDGILQENGRIDVLFNNAGITQFDDAFFQREFDGDLAKPRAMMDINFWGAVRVMQAVLPSMMKQRSGRIVNMTSLSGIYGTPFLALYSASKHALEGFSEGIAKVLRKAYNIRVSTFEPAMVRSPAVKSMSAENGFKPEYICGAWDEKAQDLFRSYWDTSMADALDRIQEPEEVVRVIEGIIRSDSPHLRYQSNTGATFYLQVKMVDSTGDSAFEAHSGIFK